MKKTIRQKGEEFIKEFNAYDWEISYKMDFFTKSWYRPDSFLYLIFRGTPNVNNWEETIKNIDRVYVSGQLTIHPIEFVLKKFSLNGMTLGLASTQLSLDAVDNGLVYQGNDNHDYWDELLPIWSQQYHQEILPQLKRFEDLQELHDYDAQFDITKSIFGSNRIHKRLVLKWLISDSGYKDYTQWALDRYDDIVKNPRPANRLEIYKKEYEGLQNLISYLDTLDVEAYLSEKPWQEEYIKNHGSPNTPKKRSPIITEQLSMVVIDAVLDTAALSSALGRSLVEQGEATAAEAMIMQQTGDIYVLTDQERTILFMSDMTGIAEIDWSRLSQGRRVMGFMRYEGTTMSYQLEYWQDGQCHLSRMDTDEIRITDSGAQHETYSARETVDLIETLFSQIAGRGLDQVYEDEVLIRYTPK